MKALKYAAIAVAAIVVLLLAGIAVIVSQFNGPRLQAEAAKLLLEKKQRTLRFDGELALSFWPNVGVKVGRTALSEHASTAPFASIDGARLSVAVLPLLSGRVVVDSVHLDGLKAQLVVRKDGSLNIADLAGGAPAGASAAPEAPAPGAPAGGSGAGNPLHVDVAGIEIRKAALEYRDERSGEDLTISGLDLSSGPLQFDSASRQLHASRLALAVQGSNQAAGQAQQFDLRLDAPALVLAPDKSSGEPVHVVAHFASGPAKAALDLTLAGIEGNAQEVKVGKLAVDVTGAQDASQLHLQLAGALAARIDGTSLHLGRFDGSLELADPRMPMKQVKVPFNGDLAADLAAHTAQGSLGAQFDDSKLSLKFAALAFAPPNLNFDLDIDRFDLDRYLPPAKPGPAAGGKEAAPKDAGAKDAAPKDAQGREEKIDLSALKGPTVAGTAHLGHLQAHNLKVDELKLALHLAKGRLELSQLSARLYGGTLEGAASVDADGNAVALRQALAGVQVGPLLKDLAGQDILDGGGNVALDVTARASTVGEATRSLAGRASLALHDGALKGINLAQSFRDVKGRLSGKSEATPSQAGQKTDFSELSASFKIANGVAHNDDLAAKSPFLRLGGSGDIDIGQSRLDYVLKASVVNSAGGEGDKDLAQLKGVTVPVHLRGPFAQPSWQIDFGAMAGDLAKAKVDEAKQKAKEQVKGKLQDQLKGLLGK